MAGADDSSDMWPQSPPDAPPSVPTGSHIPDFDMVLQGARAGDSWAFERLFQVFAGPLRRFALARGAQDPDGLANDVLVEVFRALHNFRGDEGALRGFMFHVARKRLIDDYRKQSRQPKQTLGFDGHEQTAAGDGIDEMLGLDRALALLDQLTPDQRDVLLLRVLCDLSIAETAAALNKRTTAIKALQRRAIASLREKIRPETVS